MTKEQAINELTRAASLCPTTPLAEACRVVVDALGESLEHDCVNCRNADRMPGVYPCNQCIVNAVTKGPTKWEPKEVDNGWTLD